MQYLLLIHRDEAEMAAMRKEDLQTMSAAYMAYTKALREADVWRGRERLHPASSGAIVRAKDGKSSVLNGPYAEAKEASFRLIGRPAQTWRRASAARARRRLTRERSDWRQTRRRGRFCWRGCGR